MTMYDERYVMTIKEGHDGVRLRDQKTGETCSFTEAKALYDALGVLAEWREREQTHGTDMPAVAVVIDDDGDRWTLQDNGLYEHRGAGCIHLVHSLDHIKGTFGIREKLPTFVIDGEGDRWTLQSDGLYEFTAGFRRSLDSIRETYGIQEELPTVVIDGDGDEWALQSNGLYDYHGAGGVHLTRSLAAIREIYGIRETR